MKNTIFQYLRELMITFNCARKLGVICAGVAQPGLECQSTQKGNTHNLEVVGSKPTPGTSKIRSLVNVKLVHSTTIENGRV